MEEIPKCVFIFGGYDGVNKKKGKKIDDNLNLKIPHLNLWGPDNSPFSLYTEFQRGVPRHLVFVGRSELTGAELESKR